MIEPEAACAADELAAELAVDGKAADDSALDVAAVLDELELAAELEAACAPRLSPQLARPTPANAAAPARAEYLMKSLRVIAVAMMRGLSPRFDCKAILRFAWLMNNSKYYST